MAMKELLLTVIAAIVGALLGFSIVTLLLLAK
mgnify:CR=1 FL=1